MNPNILILVIDSFRSDKFYGPEKTSFTPNIDKLLKNGVYFSQTISSAPASIPAVSSIFTGLYPFQSLELNNNFYNLKKEIPNLISLLKKNRYYTTTTIPNILKLMQLEKIFDDIESYDDKLTLYDGLGDQILNKLEEIDKKSPWLFYLHLNDIHGQAIFHKNFIHPDFKNKKLGKNQYERMISLLDIWIGKFLEKINLDETLVIITSDHGSDVASFDDEMEALSRSAKEKLMVEKTSVIKSGQKISSKLPKFFKPLRKHLSKKYKDKRNEVIEKQINPVIKNIELTQTDPYKKRLLINLLKSATLPYDERFRIPLLFTGYGINNHKIISKQSRSIDIFPTILNILKYENTFKIHGAELDVFSTDAFHEDYAFLDSHKNVEEGIHQSLIGIRTSKFKYFRDKSNENLNVHLYDLKNDPLEIKNISDSNPEKIIEMESIIKKVLSQLNYT